MLILFVFIVRRIRICYNGHLRHVSVDDGQEKALLGPLFDYFLLRDGSTNGHKCNKNFDLNICVYVLPSSLKKLTSLFNQRADRT
jgi:hypothetical protein